MIYVPVGKLGNGKTLVSVSRAFDHYLKNGRPVATNVDLKLDGYFSPFSKKTYIRLPDYPKYSDLKAIGKAYEGPYDESKFGLLLLDEGGIILDARGWSDPGRHEIIAHLRLLRKLHWDLILISQGLDSLDAQFRKDLAEHVVVCKSLDRVRIPLFGKPLQFLGFSGKLPAIRLATVKYGIGPHSPVTERWSAGTRFYKCYDTEQTFSPGSPILTKAGIPLTNKKGDIQYEPDVCIHSVLSPWHMKGRYMDQPLPFFSRLYRRFFAPPRVNPLPLKPKLQAVSDIMKLRPDDRIARFKEVFP